MRPALGPSQQFQGYFERYLVVPQIKQLGAAIEDRVADPAGHQSVVGKWRFTGRRETVPTWAASAAVRDQEPLRC